MSTNDVPGANPSNHDELATGCWAEHSDGSLIFVESTEANRVVYSMFDMAHEPPIEYRDAMPEVSFKRTFTWDPAGKKTANEKWTWHDKTPFPWDKIIKEGFADGPRMAAAEHVTTAAERIAASRRRHAPSSSRLPDNDFGSTAAQRVADQLELQGAELDRANVDHRFDKAFKRMEGMMSRLSAAISRLPGGKNSRSRATK